ncbi:DUF4148 domain-containing protein [Paraburkholderia kirstenboschensis]|uniref:DUF4148 domain-containing protein n=1 Tax=Paraburkholderia kirstenboschensis TaxID=1245436 RepID=A0ABZ0EUS1_9BURK|nr:DUF4148 domain-containing protein [Paraburkholderia kirstenboschensis]WOD20860.1 DUF4148 domain-containing protein [Paraburkholderia kirstenboschensis]
MRSLVSAVALASALAAPAVSFALSNAPVTRAQVRAELVQLEKAGYHVGDGHTTYPAEIQAAEAKAAAQNGAASGYGGAVAGSSEAGHPVVSMADRTAIYNHR